MLEDPNLLANPGLGSFAAPLTLAPAETLPSAVAGDFNGDGGADLAVSEMLGSSSGVRALLGRADGAFAPQALTPTASSATASTTGDFNGDGRLDLVVRGIGIGFNSEPYVGLLLGDGSGGLGPAATFPVHGQPISTVAGDFNGDGNRDLAVANLDGDGTVGMLLGNGTLAPQVTFSAGAGVNAIAAGDFNGDGRLDLAAANNDFSKDTAYLELLPGNGTAALDPGRPFPSARPRAGSSPSPSATSTATKNSILPPRVIRAR